MPSLLVATKRDMNDAPGYARYDAVPEDAQSRFVAENMRRVFLLIYRIVRNVDDAQDLTQEAFIKALQHQEQSLLFLFSEFRPSGKRQSPDGKPILECQFCQSDLAFLLGSIGVSGLL